MVTKLVKLNTCNIDTDGAVDVKKGLFITPQDGVYKTSFTGKLLSGASLACFTCLVIGVMKVQGQSKVHANILKRNMKGKLKTQVAGFAKLTSSGLESAMFGAELAVSEAITSYSRIAAGEELAWAWGGTRRRTVLGGLRVGGGRHYTLQFS